MSKYYQWVKLTTSYYEAPWYNRLGVANPTLNEWRYLVLQLTEWMDHLFTLYINII